MAIVYERLGACVLSSKLEDLGLEDTPLNGPYEDEKQSKQ